jgi:hypothetical protein
LADARPLPFKAFRDGKLAQLAVAYKRRLEAGFATAEFDGQPEPETLQCRDETDQIRWLALIMKCQAAIEAGFGDQPIDPPIRCTSNREYAVSHSDALSRMQTLMAQVGEALKHSWALKDEIRACPTREALFRIELEEGWP